MLDCRPVADFSEYCLATSLNLPPTLLLDGGADCDAMVEAIRAMADQGCVFCFVDSTTERRRRREHGGGEAQKGSFGTHGTQSGGGGGGSGGGGGGSGGGPPNHAAASPRTVSAHVEQWILFLAQRNVPRCAVVDGSFDECKLVVRSFSAFAAATSDVPAALMP